MFRPCHTGEETVNMEISNKHAAKANSWIKGKDGLKIAQLKRPSEVVRGVAS